MISDEIRPSRRTGTARQRVLIARPAFAWAFCSWCLSRKLGFEKRTHKAWHRRHKIGTRAHQMDGAKLRFRLAGERGFDPCPQRLARHIDPQNPNHRDRWPSKYA